MEFDYSRLKGRIRELNLTQDEAAIAAGLAKSTFSLKINGHFGFKQDEVLRICDALRIPYDQIHLYFYQIKSKE